MYDTPLLNLAIRIAMETKDDTCFDVYKVLSIYDVLIKYAEKYK